MDSSGRLLRLLRRMFYEEIILFPKNRITIAIHLFFLNTEGVLVDDLHRVIKEQYGTIIWEGKNGNNHN